MSTRKAIIWIIIAVLVGLIWGFAGRYGWAGDPTGYWQREAEAGRAPDASWWKGLHAGGFRGIACCDVADGEKVLDVDWDTQRDDKGDVHYRVRLLGEWHVVPDSAVVIDPNIYGPAVVWPVYGWDGDKKTVSYIRCFMPGAGM